MRFLTSLIFILFNIYLIESVNKTDSENSQAGFESENGEIVPGSAQKRSDDHEEVFYEEYVYDDSRENSISEKTEKPKGNSTESADPVDGFPNEVFMSLRNITADAATAFRSFTNRNDVVDLQASASDNLNVTVNNTFEGAESAGINMRALRNAEHSPQIIDEGGGEAILLPYKHTKIDTADLSDCALQGEWKPMGVAHGHLHVGGDQPNVHHAEVLQSVGSYAVPNKIIPHWQQNQLWGSSSGKLQDDGYNHKPSGLYAGGTGGASYGSGFGYGSGPGFPSSGVSGINTGTNHHHGGGGGFSGSGLGQFQKIKSGSMLSPPPVPPIIFGKKPGYWKLSKTKHKFFPGKGRRPGGGYSGAGSYGFTSQVNHGVNSGSGSGHGYGNGGGYSGSYMPNYLGQAGGGGLVITDTSGHFHHGGGDGGSGVINHIIKGSGEGSLSGYGSGSGGVLPFSGGSHKGHGFESGSGNGFSSSGGSHGFGVGTNGEYSSSGGVGLEYENKVNGGYSNSGSAGHSGSGFGGKNSGVISIQEGSTNLGHLSHAVKGGGAVAGHLIGGSGVFSGNSDHDSETRVEEELSEDHGYSSGGQDINGLISASGVGSTGGDGATAVLVHSSGSGLSGKHLMSLSHGAAGGESLLPEAAFLSTELKQPSESVGQYSDSTFSSTHLTQGLRGGNSLPAAAFMSSHINQDFSVHAQGVSDDLSSSTFTCGKNHDHNTNYHTATFQVADHDLPSSVDVLQYGGDAAVLIQSGDASFHDQILPERKLYKASHLSDAEVSGSDNRNELTSQTTKLTNSPTEQDGGQTAVEATKLDDGEEPERHSYYREITKVTKIPATSVGSVQYTFSQYETKPQTFSTESDTAQGEPEAEQPQILRELEHLSNKFQLDLDNPQKLFEDPPTQELAYHYPFQDGEHQDSGKTEGTKEENYEGITEFPYQYFHNSAHKIPQYPMIYKKPIVKYIPRPEKPLFHQKNTVKYLQPKPPLIVIRKPKPKQFLKKKQNYEVHEHSGERHRPVGEIFPPQKFPKQFHNPKPNFAVDRPKNGWRPDVYQYKYDYSHGKKVRKFKTKAKVVAPVLIRRPVSPAPVIRVVEVSG